MNGSNGNVIELLERIALGIEKTNERVDELKEETRAGFARVDKRLESIDAGVENVDRGLERVEGRLDNVIEFMGQSRADHETRIRALEAEVFKKSG